MNASVDRVAAAARYATYKNQHRNGKSSFFDDVRSEVKGEFRRFFRRNWGLENSTPIRSSRKLRNCGEMMIPGIPRESPGLALDLALGLGAEKQRLSWRL
jgi:hypothetical protein